MDKREGERQHSNKRLQERFDLTLNREERNDLIQCIQNGNGVTLFDRQSNRITRWLVDVKGKQMVAVYDRNRKQIVTFLEVDNTLSLEYGNPYPVGSKMHKAFEEGKIKQRNFDQKIFSARLSEGRE